VVQVENEDTFGKDLEAGYWVGMARISTCNYSTTLKIFGSRPIADMLAIVGGPPAADDEPVKTRAPRGVHGLRGA
jgi:hypothetical protein